MIVNFRSNGRGSALDPRGSEFESSGLSSFTRRYHPLNLHFLLSFTFDNVDNLISGEEKEGWRLFGACQLA